MITSWIAARSFKLWMSRWSCSSVPSDVIDLAHLARGWRRHFRATECLRHTFVSLLDRREEFGVGDRVRLAALDRVDDDGANFRRVDDPHDVFRVFLRLMVFEPARLEARRTVA